MWKMNAKLAPVTLSTFRPQGWITQNKLWAFTCPDKDSPPDSRPSSPCENTGWTPSQTAHSHRTKTQKSEGFKASLITDSVWDMFVTYFIRNTGCSHPFPPCARCRSLAYYTKLCYNFIQLPASLNSKAPGTRQWQQKVAFQWGQDRSSEEHHLPLMLVHHYSFWKFFVSNSTEAENRSCCHYYPWNTFKAPVIFSQVFLKH